MTEPDFRYAILADNRAHGPGLAAEHGLSIWLEVGAERILFDTGRSDVFLRNARTLGIDLRSTTRLALSHGHYDHAGGLADLAGVLPPATPLYAHPEIFLERYSRHPDGTRHEIGLPAGARDFLRPRAADFRPVTEPTEIAPGVWLTGPIPRLTGFEDTGGDFWLDRECTRPDPVADDQALWLERAEGLWVFLGCAHAGVVNTLRHIQAVSGCDRIRAVIGGTHLRSASPERLEKTAAFLRALAPRILLPCHCSGEPLAAILADSGPKSGPA